MKTAFIVCSRLDSSRVPRKALVKINGRPMLAHLFERLRKTGIDIILAIPERQHSAYVAELHGYLKDVKIFFGNPDCPLQRTAAAAREFEVENVIRVTHDKLFVDNMQVFKALDYFNRKALDYLYSTKFVDGSAFEIMSRSALEKAASKYKNVEFIGYAVRSITDNTHNFDLDYSPESPTATKYPDARLLLDYPADKSLLETVLSGCGNDCSLQDALRFLSSRAWARNINRLPKVTIYTCAHNAEKFIEKAMGSVAKQKLFRDMEYILVDDCSDDETTVLIAKFCSQFKNARWVRNETNLGLASSSNIALKMAKGRYIMRLDADDFFPSCHAVAEMVAEIEQTQKDVIIPNNYFGTLAKVQSGKECMHVGGALFRTRAVNHVKFTDGLRGYEGLDFFTRARDQLDIGYLNKPMFFYRQRPDSMSKTNLKDRTRIKQDILAKASETGVPV